MPSNPDSQIVFRDVELSQFYDENHGRDRRHQAAKIDLERYRFLIEQSLPRLSEGEAIALWSAINGASTSHVEMMPTLKQSIISELDDIDLIYKVKEWSLIEWFAVIDACDRVGSSNYQIESLSKELKKVGLC